jgi:hypothetical protein
MAGPPCLVRCGLFGSRDRSHRSFVPRSRDVSLASVTRARIDPASFAACRRSRIPGKRGSESPTEFPTRSSAPWSPVGRSNVSEWPSRAEAWSCARRRQGSPLRSDPAGAGPSDLDDACAQLPIWQLRDGHRDDRFEQTQMAEVDDGIARRYSANISPVLLHRLSAIAHPTRSASGRRSRASTDDIKTPSTDCVLIRVA